MRSTFLAFPLAIFTALAAEPASTASEVQGALTGRWAGTLEYRDYSEPATSVKRVKLPTWLTITSAEGALTFHYIYDDGPGKTITETSLIRIEPAASHYTAMNESGKITESCAVAGLTDLQMGRGVLTLTGSGEENHAQVSVRTTIRVGRNILEITRETASPGQSFTFRHAYTLVRRDSAAG